MVVSRHRGRFQRKTLHISMTYFWKVKDPHTYCAVGHMPKRSITPTLKPARCSYTASRARGAAPRCESAACSPRADLGLFCAAQASEMSWFMRRVEGFKGSRIRVVPPRIPVPRMPPRGTPAELDTRSSKHGNYRTSNTNGTHARSLYTTVSPGIDYPTLHIIS